jgi:flagellar biosynthesis protein FlhB
MVRYECAAWVLAELEQQDADPAIIETQRQHSRELRRQMMSNAPECETVEENLTVAWIK